MIFSNSLNFSNLFAHFKKKSIACLLNISFDFLMFFSHFFLFFFYFLFGKLKKKFNARCQFCLWFFLLFCFVFWKCFAGTEHDDARRLADVVSTSRLLDSRSGSGWESADTKRTPRANETQCEQQVRVQMRPQLEATRGGWPCNTNMFERVARYTVTPLLPRCYQAVNSSVASLRDAVRHVWREWTRLRLRRLGGSAARAMHVVLGVLSELMRG